MINQITTTETVKETTIVPTIATDATPIIPASTTQISTKIISSDQHDPKIRKRNSLGYYLTLGIRGLLSSKKGSFSILVLIITTIALFTSKISGMEFCSAITIIAGIYAAGATATDIQNIRSQ